MIDTHCHLDFPIFDTDRDAVLQRSRDAGVHHWLIPAVTLQGLLRMQPLQAAGISMAVGLHPMFMADHPSDPDHAVALLEPWLERLSAVAIGEVGLDYWHKPDDAARAAQKGLLDAQIQLAKRHQLPLILHIRKAQDDVLALLRKRHFAYGGIVHAYSGSAQQAAQFIKLGFKLGLGGVMTWPGSRKVRGMAQQLPLESFVLESDAPDLPTHQRAGERNEPACVAEVAQELALLRQEPLERIIQMTGQSLQQVLPKMAGLPKSGVDE
uniref:Putative Mg-dependent DNase. Uncharacterized deoxyribonuclease yjjV n=1 Tax=Magnetococcus massalia (strain MO-1) TaxID=451514 RepID=A0A1S7LE14_MAGMO|nr:Putative Mg-dependent DNase. Uncharacterized deoxyribonuclease yjjV [Candidatus Magnetococcus massalia]